MKLGVKSTFKLTKVNLVIMNPPFTSQNNLSPDYRQALKLRFNEYTNLLFWKTSQQIYFLLLADRFLEKDGGMAAVLPLTTFTGVAFRPLIRFLVDNYTIEAIVTGLARSSFSEDTSLTECLFIARKKTTDSDHRFKLIGLYTRPETWKERDIKKISTMISKSESNPEFGLVTEIPQTELLPENQALSTLFLRQDQDYNRAWIALNEVYNKSATNLLTIKELFSRGLEITEVYHGKYRFLQVGPKAIAAMRTLERAVKNTDRLVFHKQQAGKIEFVDKIDAQAKYVFASNTLSACIRRFSYLRTMNASNDTDFIASEISPELEHSMHSFYPKAEANRHLRNIKRSGWQRIIKNGSARVNICARANLAAPGTMLLAYRATNPAFLTAYGYNVKGLENERQEKLFTLWFNSTMALIQLLAKATITEGSWVKLEQFTTEQVTMPDPSKLTEHQWKMIEECWTEVSDEEVPSLILQLRQGDSVREHLDVTLLRLLGINESEARSISKSLAKGALAALELLRRTMRKGVDDKDDS